MRTLVTAAVVAALVAAGAAKADASPILPSSTGMSGGAVLPLGATDSNWTLVAQPGSTAVLGAPGVRYVHPAYVADGPASAWLSISASGNAGAFGMYEYQTTFDLTGFDPSTVVLAGLFSTDNDGFISLNGGPAIASTGFADFGSMHPFLVSSGFVAGLNTFQVFADNGGDPTSFRVEFDRIAGAPITATVPEPATLTLLALGLGGAAARRRQLARS